MSPPADDFSTIYFDNHHFKQQNHHPTMKAEHSTTSTAGADTDSIRDGDMTIIGGESALFDKFKTEAPFGQERLSMQEVGLQDNVSEQVLSDYEGDPKNPRNWSAKKRWTILALVAFQGTLGPLTDSIYLPAILEVAKALNTNLTVINASISVYIFGMGFASLFWGPLSELIGRRPIYVATVALYIVTSAICAISNTVGLFITMRVLQSFAAGAAMTVGSGTITDIFGVKERGIAIGIFSLGPLLGPVIGPIAGGYIAQYLGWHWIFWILTMVGGVVFISTVFFIPETLYKPNLPQPIAAPKTTGSRAKAIIANFPNPFKPLYMYRLPPVLLACFNLSFIFGWFYLLITILPVALAQDYGFSSGTTGLCYLANSGGNIIGAVGGGRVLDFLYVRLTVRNKGVAEPEMRLHVMWVGLVIVPLAFLIYGWTLQDGYTVALPLVGFFLMGVGMMTYMTGTNSYLLDSYTESSASVSAACNFMNSTWAAITPLFANTWRNSMNDGWMDTIIAILVVLTAINIGALVRYGKYWRERFPA